MKHAFEKAGLTRAQTQAYATCREFIDASGTLEQWIEVYKLTAARLPNEEPDSEEAAPAPTPARVQSLGDRSAAGKVTKAIAVSAFERELTHTGRQWGNVCYRELDSLREDGDIAAAIKAQIGAKRGNDRNKKISELMTPRAFAAVIRKTRGERHAA